MKIQVSLKQDKNNGTLYEDQYIFLSYLAKLFFERETFQIKNVQKITIHISCSIIFFSKILSFMG